MLDAGGARVRPALLTWRVHADGCRVRSLGRSCSSTRQGTRASSPRSPTSKSATPGRSFPTQGLFKGCQRPFLFITLSDSKVSEPQADPDLVSGSPRKAVESRLGCGFLAFRLELLCKEERCLVQRALAGRCVMLTASLRAGLPAGEIRDPLAHDRQRPRELSKELLDSRLVEPRHRHPRYSSTFNPEL